MSGSESVLRPTRSPLPLLILVVIVIFSALPCDGLINLYLPKWEMRALVGLPAELYYLHDGKVNDYALGFQMPVPPDISQMHFAWKRLINEPIPYSIALRHLNDMSALKTPTINITKKGIVPTQEEVFCITLECTGYLTAEVSVEVIVNVTYAGDTTSLVLKRKKICLQHIMEPTPLPGVIAAPHIPPIASHAIPPTQSMHHSYQGQHPNVDHTSPYIPQGGEVIDSDSYDGATIESNSIGAGILNPHFGSVLSPSPTSQSALYIVLGSLVGIVLVVIVLSLVCFIRSKSNAPPSPAYSDCTTTLTLPKRAAMHGNLSANYCQNQAMYQQYQTMIANNSSGNAGAGPAQHCTLQFQPNDRASSANSSTVVNPLLFKAATGKKGSLLPPFSTMMPPPVPANPPNSLPIYSSSLFNSLQRRQNPMNPMSGSENQHRNVIMGVSSPSSHLYENPSPLEPLNYMASGGTVGGNMNIMHAGMTGTLMSRGSDSLMGGCGAGGHASGSSARGSSCAGDPNFL